MKINQLLQLIKDNAGPDGAGKVRAETASGDAHVYIDGVIDGDWGAGNVALVAALAEAGGKDVHMHINSPGGDVFEARAMASSIVAYAGKVIAHIDGMSASAATYLALSANEVQMTEGGLFMIHNSWTLGLGDRRDLRATADLLEKIDGTINKDYAAKTGASTEQIAAWMDATTWFTAEEALAAKFIDSITTNTKGDRPAARWNLSAYANAPALAAPPEPDPLLAEKVAAQLTHNRNRLRLFQI